MTTIDTGALLGELREGIARHARPDETTAVDGVLLAAADRVGEPRASTTGTVLAVIAQGAKRLALGDRVYEYRAGQYLVASVDLPITGHYSEASPREPALGFGLVLRPSVIASVLLDAGAPDRPPRARAAPGPRPPASASRTPPPSCWTPWCACCACWTGPTTGPCSRRCSSARSCGACSPAPSVRACARSGWPTAA